MTETLIVGSAGLMCVSWEDGEKTRRWGEGGVEKANQVQETMVLFAWRGVHCGGGNHTKTMSGELYGRRLFIDSRQVRKNPQQKRR